MSTIVVTGGAGFIGSAVCRQLLADGWRVINLDALTYAAAPGTLSDCEGHPAYRFVHGDIGNSALVNALLAQERPAAVMNLAAESHVDRSLDGPAPFIDTNIVGTFRLLEAVLAYWNGLDPAERVAFRFHHVSTDEVFGDLPFDSGVFTEETPYAPSSPYSASKAASDHLVRAWGHSFGLPVLISNCSNNYGPYHLPEKLIPLTIVSALGWQPIRVYGTGQNVRDWLYVGDHAAALANVLTLGTPGESYNIGGSAERTNLQVVEAICDLLDARVPASDGRSRRELITFVTDRPGHDRRYAIDATKAGRELGWHAQQTFESGLARTVDWYLANADWWEPLLGKTGIGARLGVTASKPAGMAGG